MLVRVPDGTSRLTLEDEGLLLDADRVLWAARAVLPLLVRVDPELPERLGALELDLAQARAAQPPVLTAHAAARAGEAAAREDLYAVLGSIGEDVRRTFPRDEELRRDFGVRLLRDSTAAMFDAAVRMLVTIDDHPMAARRLGLGSAARWALALLGDHLGRSDIERELAPEGEPVAVAFLVRQAAADAAAVRLRARPARGLAPGVAALLASPWEWHRRGRAGRWT